MKLVLAVQTIFLRQGEEDIPAAGEVLARFEGPDGAQLTQANIEEAGWIVIDNSVSLLADTQMPALMRDYRALFFNLSVETLRSKTAFALWLERLRQMAAAYPRRIGIEISNRSLDVSDKVVMQRIELLAQEPVMLILDNAELDHGPSAVLTDIKWHYCKISARDLARIAGTRLKLAIDYCRLANIHIIAERIETPKLQEAVAALRIPFRQGFVLSKPQAVGD